jgi:hypothetical protein
MLVKINCYETTNEYFIKGVDTTIEYRYSIEIDDDGTIYAHTFANQGGFYQCVGISSIQKKVLRYIVKKVKDRQVDIHFNNVSLSKENARSFYDYIINNIPNPGKLEAINVAEKGHMSFEQFMDIINDKPANKTSVKSTRKI